MDNLLATLAGYDAATLAAWFVPFNAFAWPDDFPIPRPPGYDAAPRRSRDGTCVDRYTLQRPVMQALRVLTTEADRSRAWWRHLGRTDAEWQEWWESDGQAFYADVREHMGG